MFVKLAFFIMLSTLQSIAKAQNAKLNQLQGIIIYPDAGELPQEIIFIPCDINKEVSISDNLENSLKKTNGQGFIVYFQGMRWLIPGLKERLMGLYSIQGTFDRDFLLHNKVRITMGKITFDEAAPGNMGISIQHDEFLFELSYGNKKLTLKAIDDAKILGIPQFFERLED